VSAEGGDEQSSNELPWWGTLLVLAFLAAGVYGLYVAGAAAVGLVTDSDESDRVEEREAASDTDDGGRRSGERGDGVLVVAVIDGDTVELEGIGRSRLIGVDTPEEGECYETAATRYMKRTVLGERVRVAYQQERRDRFDRALVDISKSDRLIALELARLGYAEELTIAPNDRYAPRIRQAVARAESRQRGRWNTCEEDRDRARGDDDNDRRQRDRDRDRSSPAPAPQRDPEPEAEPAPEPEPKAPSVPSGTCSEVGINDFPVPPGDPRDRDGDGIACES
jgi:endonuclease YncB( thermonuclease family)